QLRCGVEHVIGDAEVLTALGGGFHRPGPCQAEDPADVLGRGQMDRPALGPGAHDLSGVDGGPHGCDARGLIGPESQGDRGEGSREVLRLDAAEVLDDRTGRRQLRPGRGYGWGPRQSLWYQTRSGYRMSVHGPTVADGGDTAIARTRQLQVLDAPGPRVFDYFGPRGLSP